MPITTILAPGNTAAPSTDVALSKDDVVTLSLFAETVDLALPFGAAFAVRLATAGTPVVIAALDMTTPAVQLNGPGTFSVLRPAYVGQAAGVCVEADA